MLTRLRLWLARRLMPAGHTVFRVIGRGDHVRAGEHLLTCDYIGFATADFDVWRISAGMVTLADGVEPRP